ncbi:DUF7507 domain-containing protein, partial [Streptomyces kasugaensis]|uniref:DUF7507 domain-containing protein n=1 Tax=Streptomyces kasugaensis TaxID=1946 RepID=UPI003BF8FAD2
HVTYTYTVTNTGNQELTDIHITDDHVTNITCETTTLAPGAATTCTGTYTVTEADAQRGSVTNIAVATADNGTVRSEPARATIQVQKKPCHGDECNKPCHGKECKPCHGKECNKPCHGKDCKPCHGKHCGKPCHGKHPGKPKLRHAVRK